MGLSLRGIAIGAMERGSEMIQEQREEARELVDSSVKMWTEMGLPVFRARKKQRRELEQAAEILKNEGFSNDQIYTAMRQGKHQAVIDHVGSLKKRNLAVKPADIITFAQDDAGYQSTGMTMDQVLDGVMGKLDTGMSLSDAIADTTGKNVSGIQAALMKKRAGAIQSAFGIDPTELRSLARQDFTYGEDIGGTLNIVDPEAAAKAKKSIEGDDTTGMTSVDTLEKSLFAFGADLVGGKEQVTASGIIYSFQQPERRVELRKKISEITSKFEEKTGRSKFNAKERNSMISELQTWATETYGPEAEADAATKEAASKIDAIKNNMRSNTSWLEMGQARKDLRDKLAFQLIAAGQATDDTAISKATRIILDMEQEIKAAQAASATSNNTGSITDTSSDFAGGA